MRISPFVVSLGLVIGCSEPAFRPATLPDLVAEPVAIKELAPATLVLAAGEHLIWDVRLHGMTIGRAELDVGETDVRSRFKTDSLASMVMAVDHELSTTLDRAHARARGSVERLAAGDKQHQYEAMFAGSTVTMNGIPGELPGGSFGQTMHSALGVLRAWAGPDANPGYLTVVAMGDVYRLDVMRPTVEDLQGTKTLRVDGRIRAKSPITLVMWLAATPDRTPLRIELSNEDFHITAELVRE